jgi:hypothetical protein
MHEPVCVPALATPKSDEIRLNNAVKTSLNYLEAMRLLALDTLQKTTDARQHTMAALTLDLDSLTV